MFSFAECREISIMLLTGKSNIIDIHDINGVFFKQILNLCEVRIKS
jgi:hypothetical protein